MAKNTPRNTDKVSRTSASITEDQLSCLRQCIPEAFTESKVDFTKLRDILGDIVDDRTERYSFTWAGKKDAIRLLQVPSRATLTPDKKESVDFDEAQHLFLEGDNLEVLKLLYKPYFGRVKMIYIDPPYNTGSDFIYPDNYADPLDTYLKLTGQKDTNGNMLTSNADTNGRYHSSWLSMMYPRLFLARQLLRDDGVIFVSIDDTESHNLKMLMNDIFGEENFIASVCWQKKYAPANDTVDFSSSHDFILVYGKQRTFTQGGKAIALLSKMPRSEENNKMYKNPDNDPRGLWRPDNYLCNKSAEQRPNLYYPIIQPKTGKEILPSRTAVWRYSRERHEQNTKDNRVWWGLEKDNSVPAYKRFLSEVGGIIADTWWSYEDVGHNDEAKKELKSLFPDAEKHFDTPKPTRLIKRMLHLATSDNPDDEDIILDFFAGSCSTADAVLALNQEDGGSRRCIMVQIPEPTDDKKLPTIADIGKERIRRVLKKLKSKEGFKVFSLGESNYRPWKGTDERTMEKWTEQMGMFVDPLVDGWKPENLIYEVAVKEGYGLNVKIERLKDKTTANVYRISDADKEQSFYICLDDEVSLLKMTGLNLTKDDLFICRDKALTDEGAANLALQCRLKTI